MDKPGQWFVVQTLSGQEMKAKESIEHRIEPEEMAELVFEALVPMEKVTEVKQGRRTTSNRKFYPGYLMVNANLYDENVREGRLVRKLNDKVWTFISATPGVIGFIGDPPVPLSDDEVTGIMEQMHRGEEALKPKTRFEIGEIVKICDGPLVNFEGKVEDVDEDRNRLKLSVTVFGRSTPVDVEYWQVEKSD